MTYFEPQLQASNHVYKNCSYHEHDRLDVFAYSGFDYVQTFKHPQRIANALAEFKVVSARRPFDTMVQWPYGFAWNSPGFITSYIMPNRPINKERLANFGIHNNIEINYMLPQEYVSEYQSIFEKPFPQGVYDCTPEYDDYTVQRLRHMIAYQGDKMPSDVKSFVEGIGKILGAKHPITHKRRDFVRSLLKEFYTAEHQILPDAYATITIHGNKLKLPF